MAMIHASVRKIKQQLAEMKKIEHELDSIKSKIEAYIILPDEILTEKEKA